MSTEEQMRADTQQELNNEKLERIEFNEDQERIQQESYEQEQQKQYELYCELEELYNTNEPIFYLLEQYYDLDFSNMNPDDKELGKMYDLVFEHPYDDYWNLKRLIQNSSNYKGNVSLLTYEVIYGDKEKAYECLIEDTKERIKELKSNSDLILLDLKVLHKLDYNNITIANVEKIDEFLDMPF